MPFKVARYRGALTDAEASVRVNRPWTLTLNPNP